MSTVAEYTCLVRIKTSVTLPRELLDSIDRADPNRSAFLERAARAYLARLQKLAREERDKDIIEANADRLNREAADVLEYQSLP
jgi:metal-responsive CopG/Arc/MetJ family transcriptional regulator